MRMTSLRSRHATYIRNPRYLATSSCTFSLQIRIILCASTELFELESLYRSLGSEDPVSCVAKTWNDVLIFVESLVQGTDIDIYIRVSLL